MSEITYDTVGEKLIELREKARISKVHIDQVVSKIPKMFVKNRDELSEVGKGICNDALDIIDICEFLTSRLKIIDRRVTDQENMDRGFGGPLN